MDYSHTLGTGIKATRPSLACSFTDWALEQLQTDLLLYRKIMFSKVYFWLNMFVKKQNCQIWSNTNPEKILQTHHIQKNTSLGAVYTLVASSDFISLKLRLKLTLKLWLKLTLPIATKIW